MTSRFSAHAAGALLLLLSTHLVSPTVATALEPEDPVLQVLRDAAEDAPQDYATVVAWARAEEAAGNPLTAAKAWAQAEAISGGNLETQLGPVTALISLDRSRDALARTKAATQNLPDSPWSWLMHGMSLRAAGSAPWMAEQRAKPAFHKAYRLSLADTAAEADGLDTTTACWLADSRAARGDRWGARRLTLTYDCYDALDDSVRPAFDVGAGIWALGQGWANNDIYDVGLGAVTEVWLRYDDLVTASLIASTTFQHGFWETDDVGIVDIWSSQQSVWADITVAHAGHGVQLIGGSAFPDANPNTDSPTWRVGGRAWFSSLPTFTAEALYGGNSFGSSLQLGGFVSANVVSNLTLKAGARYTAAVDAIRSGTPEDPDIVASTGVAGIVSATWQAPTWSAFATGRFGTESGPYRLASHTLWNLTEPLGSSMNLGGSVLLTQETSVSMSYDLVTLAGAPEDSNIGGGSYHGVSLGVAFTLDPPTRMPR